MFGPWGAEDMSVHKGWRVLAETLAGRGYPTLRIDLDGCGDSCDLPADQDHWPAWQASAHLAIEALQRLSGVQQVVLVGMRLGALLAATMASEQVDVRALVMVAPVRSGKAYLKELRMLGGAMAQGEAGQRGGVFAAGFELNGPTVAAISASTLPDALHAKAVTVVDRDDLGIGKTWLSRIAASGVDTVHSEQPGFQHMVVTAHKAQASQAMYAKVLEAIERAAGRTGDDPHRAPSQPVAPLATQASFACVFETNRSTTVVESVIPSFGPMAMTGIWVAPAEGLPRSGNALLILNSSAERRIGPNRMWVGFARERAQRGDVIIRLDMPGLGESGEDYFDTTNKVYPPEALDRVQQYLHTLMASDLASHWGVLGLCSGGYHSFRLAVLEARIERVFALNTFGLLPAEVADFEKRSQQSLHHVVAQNTAKHMLDAQRWLKLLRGQVDVGLILHSVSSRMTARLLSRWRRIAAQWGWLPTLPLTAELNQLAARQCKVHFVFATNDPGPTLVREATANAIMGMIADGAVTEDLVNGADHVFSGLAGRAQMFRHIHRRLDEWSTSRLAGAS